MKYLHFLRRSYGLIILAIIAILISQQHEAFDALGPLVFIAATCLLVSVLQRLSVTANFSHTIDRDAIGKQGRRPRSEADWDDLEPFQRAYVTAAIKIGYLLAFAIIAASVGK